MAYSFCIYRVSIKFSDTFKTQFIQYWFIYQINYNNKSSLYICKENTHKKLFKITTINLNNSLETAARIGTKFMQSLVQYFSMLILVLTSMNCLTVRMTSGDLTDLSLPDLFLSKITSSIEFDSQNFFTVYSTWFFVTSNPQS